MEPLANDIRHELERGVILHFLIEVMNLDWVPYRLVHTQIVGQGYLVTDIDMKFHVNYCEQKGYIERKSLRSGRAGLELQMIRATTKAVDLKDGRIPADEGIKF